MRYFTSEGFLEDVMSELIISTPLTAYRCTEEERTAIFNRQIKCANLFGRLRSLGLNIELHSGFVMTTEFYSAFLNRMDRLYSKHSEILKNIPNQFDELGLYAVPESIEALLDAGIPISQILEDM